MLKGRGENVRVDLNDEIGKIRDWPKQAKIDDFGAAVRPNLTMSTRISQPAESRTRRASF